MTQAIITKNAKLMAENLIVGIENDVLRKRLFVYANVIESVSDFMSNIGFRVSTKTSLYKNIVIAKNFDVADFYIENARVDIRIMDNTTNAVLIPKSHKELGIEPDLYIVVKVDDLFKSIEIEGFIPTEQIIFDKEIQNFYVLNSKKLLSIDKFKQLSHSIKTKKYAVEISEKDIFQLYTKMQEEELSLKSQIMLLHSLLGNLPFLKKLNSLQKIDITSQKLLDMPDLLSEFAPVFVQDFADDDLGGMDNIEEVEIFGDEEIVDIPKTQVDEVLEELTPDLNKDNPDLEPLFRQESKPLILHIVAIVLIGAVFVGVGLNKKESPKNTKQEKINVINNAIIPNITAGVSNVAWGIASDLSDDKQFVGYLNGVGQIIKRDLSKEIQVTTEAATEKELKVAVVFDNNARFKNCVIKKPSGSDEIDKKTLQIIKTVFKENPSQNIQTSAPFIRAILIIKL